jgi:hypothetical protein
LTQTNSVHGNVSAVIKARVVQCVLGLDFDKIA